MDASAVKRAPDHIEVPAARIGLIIPSVNRLSEPQFTHFAPPGLGIHVTRARIAGKWRKPVAEPISGNTPYLSMRRANRVILPSRPSA